MSNRSKLICIAGMDGTGKSTLLNGLHAQVPHAAVAEIWDLLKQETSFLFISKRDVDNYLCRLTPDSRLLFLAHAMKYAMDKVADSSLVLINAYVYKYFAAELALGANRELVKTLVEAFPVPGTVIYLTAPPEVTAARKERFSRYECGLAESPSREKFTAFQEKIAAQWEVFDRKNWHVLDAS